MAILNVYTVPNLERVISSPFPYPHPMVFFFAYQHFLLVHGLSFALCLESCPLSFVKIINMSNSYWSSYPVAQMVKKKICLQYGRPGFDPWVRKIPWSKEMATHSSILARRILWTEEPGGLQFMESQRVGHD